MSRYRLVLAALCLLAASVTLSAQEFERPYTDDSENARVRFGPLAFTPVVEIRHVGVDSNIFNTAEDPQQDFTAAIGPRARYWLRAGRLRVTGDSSVAYQYFHEFSEQRSLSTENKLSLAIPLNRITPFVKAAYGNLRRRPDYEIDARVRTETSTVGVGVDLRAGSRTTLRFEGEEARTGYDDNAVFSGSRLQDALDRRERLYRLSLRQRLTPLTTFVVAADRREDRFDFQVERDADSTRVLGGFELDPLALISGEAFIGYRSFTTLDADVPDYQGVVAIVRAAYVLRATRFGVGVNRDTGYSFEVEEPFFVVTDVQGEVMQKVTTSWDIVGRLGRQALDYRQRLLIDSEPRTDTQWMVGGGIGRRLGRAARVGLDVDRVRRESTTRADREYEGWRVGGSLTYGVQ